MSQSPFGFALVSDQLKKGVKIPLRWCVSHNRLSALLWFLIILKTKHTWHTSRVVTIAFRLCFGFWLLQDIWHCKSLWAGHNRLSALLWFLIQTGKRKLIMMWCGHNRLSALLWFLIRDCEKFIENINFGHNRLSALLWFLILDVVKEYARSVDMSHNRLSALLWFLIKDVEKSWKRFDQRVTIAFRLCFGFWSRITP